MTTKICDCLRDQIKQISFQYSENTVAMPGMIDYNTGASSSQKRN